MNAQSGARTVERALALFGAVAMADGGVTLTEASREAGLAPSTATRLLRTLEAGGFVQRGEDGLYRAGDKLIQIAARRLRGDVLYHVAHRHLVELRDKTGENAYLAVRSGADSVTYLRQFQSARSIRHVSWVGQNVRIKGTAIGAAIEGRVAADGYVSTRSTVEPDVTAVAAPVRGPMGDIVAAISVVGPSFRIDDAALFDYGRWVVASAEALSADLEATEPVGDTRIGYEDARA